MTTPITRRDFLKMSAAAMTAAPLLEGVGAKEAEPVKNWYKGNLHQHSQWSDGIHFPERMADFYRENGYHFICPSDHNFFQNDDFRYQRDWSISEMPEIKDKEAFRRVFEGATSYWKPIRREGLWTGLTREIVDEHKKIYGGDSVETRDFEGTTFVRLKTFRELEAEKNDPGKFLMIPGFEQTTMPGEQGYHVHLNFVNVREAFPTIDPKDPFGILDQNFRKAEEVYEGQDYLMTANHPLWPYYDFQPSDLIRLPQITLYELTNNIFTPEDSTRVEKAWLPEQMWDIVNAHRVTHDQPLLYGMGSDDFHNMEQWGVGWSVVRAERLAAADILAAIRAGDFYAAHGTRGLAFEDIRFDGKTLEVKIDVQEEGEYVIDFIGTKKDYNPDCEYAETPYEKGKSLPRKLECYSKEIGKVLESAEGTEASYTLKQDDLYVRAKIYKKGAVKKDWETENAAWTQPYQS